MNENYCQSCGMPMVSEVYGTEANGQNSIDYCKYCYENGKFTFKGTMEEMIDLCVGPMAESNPDMTEEKARGMMRQFFPTLKRWSVK